jgi:osmoprotectant transport system substrate-binding protein
VDIDALNGRQIEGRLDDLLIPLGPEIVRRIFEHALRNLPVENEQVDDIRQIGHGFDKPKNLADFFCRQPVDIVYDDEKPLEFCFQIYGQFVAQLRQAFVTSSQTGFRKPKEKTMNSLKSLIVGLALTVAAAPALADPIVVSSKIDTEGNLLGNIVLQVLESHGLPVTNKVSLGSTPIVRKAIANGEIDIYPEYTGNAAFFFNKADDSVWKDAAKGYEEAKKLDYDANKIVWLTPAPANNTWAIALREQVASANKVKTLDDFGKWVSGGGKVKLAGSSEFVNSAAALPAFQKAYGFTLKPDQLLVLSGGDTSATIKAAAEQTDGVNAAMVYGTDGAIGAAGLVVLDDDKAVQPIYAPTPIVREAVLKAHPEIADDLKPVFASLDLKTLQTLNGRIQVNGESAKDVAADYLKSKGFVKK